jgi:hypothetical protein
LVPNRRSKDVFHLRYLRYAKWSICGLDFMRFLDVFGRFINGKIVPMTLPSFDTCFGMFLYQKPVSLDHHRCLDAGFATHNKLDQVRSCVLSVLSVLSLFAPELTVIWTPSKKSYGISSLWPQLEVPVRIRESSRINH